MSSMISGDKSFNNLYIIVATVKRLVAVRNLYLEKSSSNDEKWYL